MNYKEYIKKHKKIIEPVSDIVPMINILSIMQMLGNEVGGEFSNRIDDFIKKETERIQNSEVKEDE